MSNLAPVPSEDATCAGCGAPLVADQRYCLSCGQPVSPVRLAFLDVLDSERQPQPGTAVAPVAYAPYIEPAPGPEWLRRWAPLFAVLAVLLLAMIIGLLVGHWVTQDNARPTAQVIKVEGLAGAAGASAAATTPASTPAAATGTKAAAGSAKSEEEKEKAEAKAEEKAEERAPAKAPPTKSLNTSAVNKLESTTGAKHEAELSKLSTAPIEVK